MSATTSFQRGDHVRVSRGAFSHHGIVITDGELIIDVVKFGPSQGAEGTGGPEGEGSTISSWFSSTSAPSLPGSASASIPALASVNNLSTQSAVELDKFKSSTVEYVIGELRKQGFAGVAAGGLAGGAAGKAAGAELGKYAIPFALQISTTASTVSVPEIGDPIESFIDMFGQDVAIRILEPLCVWMGEKIGEFLGMQVGQKLGQRVGGVAGHKVGRTVAKKLGKKIGESGAKAGEKFGKQRGKKAAAEFKEKDIEEKFLAVAKDMLHAFTDDNCFSRIFEVMIPNWKSHGATGYVRAASWEEFRKGSAVTLVNTPKNAEDTLERALSKLFSPIKYDLVLRNCEQFATWCTDGVANSSQVNKAVNGAGAMCPLAFGAAGVVAGGTAAAAPVVFGSPALGAFDLWLGAFAVKIGVMAAPVAAPATFPVIAGCAAVGLGVGVAASMLANKGLNGRSTKDGDFLTLRIPELEDQEEEEDREELPSTRKAVKRFASMLYKDNKTLAVISDGSNSTMPHRKADEQPAKKQRRALDVISDGPNSKTPHLKADEHAPEKPAKKQRRA